MAVLKKVPHKPLETEDIRRLTGAQSSEQERKCSAEVKEMHLFLLLSREGALCCSEAGPRWRGHPQVGGRPGALPGDGAPGFGSARMCEAGRVKINYHSAELSNLN